MNEEQSKAELARELCVRCGKAGCDTHWGPNPYHEDCKQQAILELRAKTGREDA
jgi:hypothetical protein